MQDQSTKDLTRRSTFELFTPVTIRFCDTDKLGHVNNVSIASYVEAGRCDLFYHLLKNAGTAPEIDFVLARAAIDGIAAGRRMRDADVRSGCEITNLAALTLGQ